MQEKFYTINGTDYAESEVIAIYNFWQLHADTEDISDAIDSILESNDNDPKFLAFVRENCDELKDMCIPQLNEWHEFQTCLNESIFDFSQNFIYNTYYANKFPRRVERCIFR